MSLKNLRINLFGKIFGFSILIVGITIISNYIFNIMFLEKFYIYRKKAQMSAVVEIAKKTYMSSTQEEFREFIQGIREEKGMEIMVLGNKPYPNHDKNINWLPKRHGGLVKIKQGKFVTRKLVGKDAKLLYFREPLPKNRSLFVSTSLSVIESHSHETRIFNIVTAIIGIIVSLIVGLIFSKKLTRDISLLNKKAENISKLNFEEKISLDRNDELGDLSHNLDKMAVELSSSINNLKSFVSNASHELRTPIGLVTTHAVALLENEKLKNEDKEKYYEIILKTSMEMKELVENLLTLSKLEASVFKLRKDEIDLKDILEETLEKYDILELEKDIEVEMDIESTIIYEDKRIIKLALNNIIENALKYSPRNEKVKIYEEEGYLCVENKFEGKLDANLDLYQPFKRGENAEDENIEGSGLGLSILSKALNLSNIDYSINIEEERFIMKVETLKNR